MSELRQPSELSDEQVRLLALVARGWTDQRIGRELNLSVASVQRRLRTVAEMMGVNSRVSLAMRAVALGLVDAKATDAAAIETVSGDEGDAN